ncbi:MAG: hypothetical protein AMXMBFR7_48830 [Planctomycetota bacterium]
MPPPDRFLIGHNGLEEAIQNFFDSVMLSTDPAVSVITTGCHRNLFSDLVVFFHERKPVPSGNFPAHAGVILDLQQSLHADLERHATIGDLASSVTAALAVFRILNPQQDEGKHAEKGASTVPVSGALQTTRPGMADRGSILRDRAKVTWQMDRALLKAIREKIAQMGQLSNLVNASGMLQIIPPSRRTQPFDRIPFLDKLLQVLDGDPELLRILRILGRLTDSESHLRTVGAQPPTGELCDVTRGIELARVIPSEWILLASPELKWEFYRRFTERGLLQYEQLPREYDRGPICICIDRSSSMEGAKSALARAIALFVCKQAFGERRDTCVIFFDTEVKIIDLPWRSTTPERILEILQVGLGIENSYTTALRACRRLVRTKRLRSADILLIGDAEEEPTKREIRWYKSFDTWMEKSGTKLVTIHLGFAQSRLHQLLKGISMEFFEIQNVENPEIERISKVIDRTI